MQKNEKVLIEKNRNMNKRVLKVAFVAAIAMVSGINVFNIQESDVMSDVALANVEALADDENPGSHNHGPTRNPLLGSKYCKNENNINCAY